MKLGKKSDGTSSRDVGTDIVATDTGRVGVGTTTPNSAIHIAGSIGATDDFRMTSSSNTASENGAILLEKSRGTNALPVAVQSGDEIAVIKFRGHDGSGYQDRAMIRSYVNGTVSPGNVPTDLTFSAGSTGADERMRITSAGNVGINTTNPSNKLEINNGLASNTGLKLTTGASSGKVLTSDANGNAIWQSGANQYQTIIVSTGGTKTFSVSQNVWYKYDQLNKVVADDVKTIYGSSYGWDNTNQRYIVPRSGKYRISFSAYFNSTGINGYNMRAAVDKNGSNPAHLSMDSMPFVSLTANSSDQVGFASGIVILNQGDVLELKVANYSNNNSIALYGADSHTMLTIEAL